ncbi:xanthine dehydrogenase family protein molybdopterin-binding subunit [Yoonia sp.]|uniref:xanthine dehydrogenase family protein molybdopterin-binding subunit n=1 Tax=Yoonia sp. TaxID=2212373 RepID=UPI00391D08ED
MTETFRLDGPTRDEVLKHKTQNVLGLALDRPEGPLKVTGKACYAAEAQPDGLVHGVLARAPRTGTITDHGIAKLEALPGVLLVLTEGIPRNPAQGAVTTAPPPAEGVAYVGQPTALIVAESFEQAWHAALAYDPQITPTSPDIDPQAAQVVALPDKKQRVDDRWQKAWDGAATRVDVTITTPSMSSAPMEPHAAVATWTDDKLTLFGGLQMLKFNRQSLAEALDMPVENVRLLAPYVGGGFGSKLGIAQDAIAAARAARILGRPVSVVMHRRQVFEATTRRSESRQRLRLGCDAEGKIRATAQEYRVSNLPDEDFSEPVARPDRAFYATDAYLITHEVARVHRMAAGSVRAPGEAIGIPAFEMALDELAEAAGIDPLALRLRNTVDKDPVSGLPYSSFPLAKTLKAGAESFGWQYRPPCRQQNGEWWVGQGLASAIRIHSAAEAKARVTLSANGAVVETDQTDIGTGSYTILCQIAAEMLGLDPADVQVRLGDTDYPEAWGSGGSAGAASSGNAVLLACRALRDRLADKLGVNPDDLTLKDRHAIYGNRRTSLAEAMPQGEEWAEVGHIAPGDVTDKVRTTTCGAIFCEVAVSEVTGEIRVRRMNGTFSAGRILNHKTATSQCHGGLIWGIGMALMEQLSHDPRDGSVVNRDLAQFHIPTNADVPPLSVSLLDDPDDWAGPLGALGLGELSISGAAGAVLNAVYNAIGVRIRDLPATPERVIAALEARH